MAGGASPVLVTGAGGPAGVSVIRALASRAQAVLAVDADPLAAGLRLAPAAAVLPRFADPGYVEALCAAALDAGASAIVSTIAEEIPLLAERSDMLRAAGLAHWLPDPCAVAACLDKWRFAQVAAGAGVPVPATALGRADGVAGPWIVKPRFGRGSRDVERAERPEELGVALGRVPEALVQTRLQGREFTLDALVDTHGELAGAVPRWRLQTRGGISTRGETFCDGEVVEGARRLLRALGLSGPANVQGFVAEDGSISFVEVNPRFSGGLPLSLAAGADLVGEYLRGVRGLEVRPERLRFRPGVVMIRHFQEVFEDRGAK